MSGWITGGAAIIGGGLSYAGSKKAAEAASGSMDAATALQREIYDTTRSDMMPYMSGGLAGLDAYNERLGLGGSMWDQEQTALKEEQMKIVSDFRQRIYQNEAPEAYTYGANLLGFEGSDIRDLTDEEVLQGLMSSTEREWETWRSDLKALDTKLQDLGDRPEDKDVPGQFTLEDLVLDPGYQFTLNEGTRAKGFGSSASGMTLSGGALKDLNRYVQDYSTTKFDEAFNRNQLELANLQYLSTLGQNSAAQTGYQGAQFGQTMAGLQTDQAMINASSAAAPYNALNTAMNTGLTAYSVFNKPGTGGTINAPTPTGQNFPNGIPYNEYVNNPNL